MLKTLWNDDAGLVLSAELVFVVSILAIGMIVGLSAARDGVTSELSDVGDSITEYNNGWQVSGLAGHAGSVAGAQYLDNTDYCDVGRDDSAPLQDEGCIMRTLTQTNEASVVSPPSQVP
jgi:hypothetical protein